MSGQAWKAVASVRAWEVVTGLILVIASVLIEVAFVDVLTGVGLRVELVAGFAVAIADVFASGGVYDEERFV